MKRLFTSFLVFVGLLVCLSPVAFGNGLVISNTTLTGQNTTSQTWQVRFNITWENSWRDNVNNDVVWVFCKWSTTTGVWNHATLNTTGFVTGTGTPITLQVSCDRRGSFISRRDFGNGTLATTAVELQWAYGTDGVSNGATPLLNIYGIEMVYIPGGPFTIGDGDGVSSSSSSSFYAVSQHLPYTIDNLMSPVISATSIVNTVGSPVNFFRIDGDNGLDLNCDGSIVAGTDSASFPTGYLPFYIMKYEITQGQYCDFLNSLTYTQQTARVNNSTNSPGQYAFDGLTTPTSRQTIMVQTAGVSPGTPRVYSTARPDRSSNYLSPMDGMAYSDWAALRPLTELEYEKACRGPLPPSGVNDMPWGSTYNPCYSAVTLVGTENGTETASSTNPGFYSVSVSQGDGGTGPLRAGIMATNSSTNRNSTGNTFYGVCNMGDNLGELYVTLTHVAGRSYRGDHGNGTLLAAGHADAPNWPGANGNSSTTTANVFANTSGCTNTAGFGLKNQGCTPSTSGRGNMASASTTRSATVSFRAGRSALTSDFTVSYPNGSYAAAGTSNSFFGPIMPVGTTYSWSFPSGTPSTSSVANPQVSWSSAGTFNTTLTVTQGSCSATSIVAVPVIAACSSPAILSGTQSWTQCNASYSNSNNATSCGCYDATRIFDGNTTAGCGPSMFGYGGSSCITGGALWVVVDLVSSTNLNGIGIFTYGRAWQGTSNYDVDGVTIESGTSTTGPWTVVGSVYPTKDVNAFQNLIFPPTTSRYWRFSFTNSQDCNLIVNELRFNRCN